MSKPLMTLGLSIFACLALSEATHATTGTDSAFAATGTGYEMVDSEEPGGPLISWEDIGPAGSLPGTPFPAGWNDTLVPVSFGFPFPYYGSTYVSGSICSNGNLQLGPTPSTTPNNCDFPVNDAVNNVLAPFWDDLVPVTSSSINYKSILNDGDPRFIVQWTNVARTTLIFIFLGQPAGSLTFQLVIRPNGRIEFKYNTMSGTDSNGLQATVGIENGSGSDGIRYRFNALPALPQDNSIYSGLCINFFKTTAPAAPVNLVQTATSSGPAQPIGFITGQSLWVRAGVSDPDGNQAKLQVEALPSVTPFDPILVNGLVGLGSLVPSGSTAQVGVAFSAASYGTGSYHWRVRTLDEVGKASAWVIFDPVQPIHFWVDVSPPNPPNATTPPDLTDVTVPTPTGSMILFACDPATDLGTAGVVSYDFQVGSDAAVTQIVAGVSSAAPQASLPISQNRNLYYWHVRAVDAVGNVGPWSPVMRFRAVLNDFTDNGAKDATKGCGFGVGGPAVGGMGVLFAATLFLLRLRRKL